MISVVIVNYNASHLLGRAVEAALASAVPVEVFVVDNASTDESLGLLKARVGNDDRLHIIENHTNLGFAPGCNIALERTRGDYVVLLNPDCIVQPDALRRVVEALEADPRAGMAGCLVRNPDGTEQAGCRRAVPTPWRTVVRLLHLNRVFPSHPRFRTFLLNLEPLPEAPVPVEAISGAFMMVRRRAMQEVGLLDEGYFLHCDDLDWCMRFRAAGWNILFVPHAEATHYKGTSSRDRPIFVEWHKHKGMVRFYRKFFRRQYPGVLMWLVAAGVWIRFGLLAVYHGARRLGARSESPRG